MKKRISAVFILFIFLTFSSLVYAGPLATWRGYVTIGGAAAANGTVVQAFINTSSSSAYSSTTLPSVATKDGNWYIITVGDESGAAAGNIVALKVNGVNANQSAQTIPSGISILELNLTMTKLSNGESCTFSSGCSGNYCCSGSTEYTAGEGSGTCASSACSGGGGSSGGGGGSSSGGGGAAGGTAAVTETKTVSSIPAGSTGEFDFTKTEQLAVDEIKVEAKTALASVSVTVSESSAPTTAPAPVESTSGSVYKYLEIKAENIKTEDINKAFITFSVPKTWINTNNLDPNTVALNRLKDDVWTKLATTKTLEDSANYYYKAESPGFSIFAITAEKKKAAEVTPTIEEKPPVTEQPPFEEKPPVTEQPPVKVTPPVKGISSTIIAVVIGAIFALGLLGYLLIKKKE